MRPLIEELSQIAPLYVSVYPNAGLPNPLLPTGFPETPESLAPQLAEWARAGMFNIVGGCCGTTPPHIEKIAAAVRGIRHASVPTAEPFLRLSGNDALTLTPETNFINIGERANVTGSPKFAKLILAGNYEEAVSVARQQVENGAQIIDINMDEGMLDGRRGHDALPQLHHDRAGDRPRAGDDRQLEVERHRSRASSACKAKAS
jgi:5-methyltetrahydrofolate--homocysteine methyltransferase